MIISRYKNGELHQSKCRHQPISVNPKVTTLCTYLAVILIILSLSITLFIDPAEVQVFLWITLLCGEYLGFSKITVNSKKNISFIITLVLEIINTGTFYTLHKVYPLQIVTIVNAVITVLFGLYCMHRKRKPE